MGSLNVTAARARVLRAALRVLRDIGSMSWAWLQANHLPHHLALPGLDAGTDDLARAMGIEPDDFERHSALGDCRLVAAMLDVIEGARP